MLFWSLTKGSNPKSADCVFVISDWWRRVENVTRLLMWCNNCFYLHVQRQIWLTTQYCILYCMRCDQLVHATSTLGGVGGGWGGVERILSWHNSIDNNNNSERVTHPRLKFHKVLKGWLIYSLQWEGEMRNIPPKFIFHFHLCWNQEGCKLNCLMQFVYVVPRSAVLLSLCNTCHVLCNHLYIYLSPFLICRLM